MKLEGFTRALVALILTAILEAVANFVLNLSVDTLIIIFAIGFFSAVIIATLDYVVPSAIESAISHRLEVYRLISQIQDAEFREFGYQVLADCQYKLDQLAHGEFRSRMGARYDRERLRGVRTEVRGVYLGVLYQTLGKQHSWTSIREEQQWYDENLKALKRGIQIVRVFILKRTSTVDEATGDILDPNVIEIMKQQQRDGVQVRIAWEHVLTANIGAEVFQDFAILDRLEVLASEHAPDGTYEVVIWRNPTKVQYFERIFASLTDYSEPLDAFLAEVQALQRKQSQAGNP